MYMWYEKGSVAEILNLYNNYSSYTLPDPFKCKHSLQGYILSKMTQRKNIEQVCCSHALQLITSTLLEF